VTILYYILFGIGAISVIRFIFSNLINFLQKIKITECNLHPSYSKCLVQKDKLIIPKDTKEISLYGKYNFVLPSQEVIVFVRKNNVYYPQGLICFGLYGIWDCQVTFGEGLDTTDYTSIIIAKVNPEFEKLRDHYWYVGKKTKQWVGIEMDHCKGVIQEIVVKTS